MGIHLAGGNPSVSPWRFSSRWFSWLWIIENWGFSSPCWIAKDGIFLSDFLWWKKRFHDVAVPKVQDATIWPLFFGGSFARHDWQTRTYFEQPNILNFLATNGVVFMSRGLVRYVRWPSAENIGHLEILEAGLTSWKLGLKHISILLQAILGSLRVPGRGWWSDGVIDGLEWWQKM